MSDERRKIQESGHRKLIVWQKAMGLVLAIYDLTKSFPKDEIYGLTSQLRRAAVSIPSNIAEGSRRKTEKDRMHFYAMALGSVSEVETQIEIAERVGYAHEKYIIINALLDELARMLNRMSHPE